jgi:hypothetical protein
MIPRRAFCLAGIFCALASLVVPDVRGAAEESFDADVLFVDGRTETVSDVWEYYQRAPVRELCYIDGTTRPHIPYGDIHSIEFSEWSDEKRKTRITITLRGDTVKEGLLWDNDSFYATREDGTQWRGWISSLKQLTFRSSATPTQDDTEG